MLGRSVCVPVLVLLGVGCAGVEPAPPVLDAVAPRAQPYTPAASGGDDAATRRVERVPEWSDARHMRLVERFVGREAAEALHFAPAGVALRGDAGAVAGVERFLADRRTFRGRGLALDLRVWDVAAEEAPPLADGRLVEGPTGPVVHAVLPGWPDWDRRPAQSPSLLALDGQEAALCVGERIPVAEPRRAPETETGVVLSGDGPETLSGLRLTACTVLAAGGDLAVCDFRLELTRAAPFGGWPWVAFQGEHGQRLPFVRGARLEATTALREGEVAWLTTPDPREPGRLLVVGVDWSPVESGE